MMENRNGLPTQAAAPTRGAVAGGSGPTGPSPRPHGRGESPAVLAVLVILAVAGLVLLMVGR